MSEIGLPFCSVDGELIYLFNKIYFRDLNTNITRDVLNNLTFTDAIAGTVTLASLVAGGGPWDRNLGGWTYLDNVGDTVTIGDALTHPEKLYISGRLQMPAVADPALTGASGKIYLKTVGPRIELCYMDDAGNITQITGAGTLVHSLDQAYDDGSTVAVDNTDVDWQLTDTKVFEITSVAGGADNIFKVEALAAGDIVTMGSATNLITFTKWGDFNVEQGLIKIVPTGAGVTGLVVRDTGDTTDIITLAEDGNIVLTTGGITANAGAIQSDIMIANSTGTMGGWQFDVVTGLLTPLSESWNAGILTVSTQIQTPLLTIDSSDLTLSTTTSGNIVLNPFGTDVRILDKNLVLASPGAADKTLSYSSPNFYFNDAVRVNGGLSADSVTTLLITYDSSDLTLETTTSGNLILNPFGNIRAINKDFVLASPAAVDKILNYNALGYFGFNDTIGLDNNLLFTAVSGITQINTGDVAGVARAIHFNIPIIVGGGVAAVDYQLKIDSIMEAGLLANTTAGGLHTDSVWKIPYITGAFGADWGTFTPPAPASLTNGAMQLVYNSNSLTTRLCLYSNSSWTTNLDFPGTLDIHGILNMHSNYIQNVTDPSGNQDAATKNYVLTANPAHRLVFDVPKVTLLVGGGFADFAYIVVPVGKTLTVHRGGVYPENKGITTYLVVEVSSDDGGYGTKTAQISYDAASLAGTIVATKYMKARVVNNNDNGDISNDTYGWVEVSIA